LNITGDKDQELDHKLKGGGIDLVPTLAFDLSHLTKGVGYLPHTGQGRV